MDKLSRQLAKGERTLEKSKLDMRIEEAMLQIEENEKLAQNELLDNDLEWSQLSEEEKQRFIETAPGWPGWIF
jgi:hypothetical protein